MKNILLNILIIFLTSYALSTQAQIKSKVWYDGNARVMYDRDILTGDNLDQKDTVSTRSNGTGFSKIDLGLHFTPINEIEISSSIRLQNDFGGMWGNRNSVTLRSLSASGVIYNKIRFGIGDLFLKQSKYTLYNYSQDLSHFESDVFSFYREYVNYENYYKENYWRLQGIQTNFSYNMYNIIEQIDIDAFTSRIRGAQWLGDPELLMFGGTLFIRLNEKIKIGSHYINTFEIKSTSNTDIAYFNPVLTAKFMYSDKFLDMYPLDILVEGGVSKRGWEGDGFAPETQGMFFNSTFQSKINNSNLRLNFKLVDTDFRSIGAQTRRLNYSLVPSSYAYYGNSYTQRKIGLLDIISDPDIYNQRLSTSLMDYNPIYSATLPYGDATPNRIGTEVSIEEIKITGFLKLNIDAKYFTELIGQGTTQKRNFLNGAISSKLHINKILDISVPIIMDASAFAENIKRSGSEFERINLKTNLISSGILVGLADNLSLVCGSKLFSAVGNEYLIERNTYDQIIDYNIANFDISEMILVGGIQYYFEKDTYITMQYNHFNMLDNNNILEDEFSMGRLVFMFNMNL